MMDYKFKWDGSLWLATSNRVVGLFVCGKTIREVIKEIENVKCFMDKASSIEWT